MKAILFLLGFTLASNQTPAIHAAPSVEACPSDSVLSEDACKCVPESCKKPPCPTDLQIATNGTDVPGQCCPTYECVGCDEEQKLDGKCPCGEGATIDGRECSCVDETKHLVEGKCVCNPILCPLPQLCDKKSVAVTISDGCCKKTICKPCPSDSESTNVEGDEIEDHCVCLPCKTECGYNKTAVIKKHASGFPGNCCDLYECKKTEEISTIKGCSYGDLFYENGKEWLTLESQVCKCENGLALCSDNKEVEATDCFVDNLFHKHNETWTKDDGCTTCTCANGEHDCISYYCDVKTIQVNSSCVKDDVSFHDGDTWLESDGCTNCTCINGLRRCFDDLCEKPTAKPAECPPLVNCTKTCINGFKTNRRGCEVCKCNAIRLSQDIFTRYNISMKDLIRILDEYKDKIDNFNASAVTTKFVDTTTTSISTTPATSSSTTTESISKTVDVFPQLPNVIMNRNAEFMMENSNPVTSTTTEPSIIPTETESDLVVNICIAILVAAVLVIGIVFIYCYKSKRKSSIDLSNCHYQNVNSNHNNNNTIKKTDQLL
ncbi:unnamed protein product [Phyllotreta striolata]|uniref:Antistasin-like domain-containing protein n=1 Tax=Phyllotreta striolata TaxID=444603 RepID=A0A9P0DP49_PHYSR|nr:unnamed protein product [Phyllotreta striolata]